jgi:2-polyprenyl-3-methyl-5-hydroxy-6-metoxy-1,4-benzoquinol methylase
MKPLPFDLETPACALCGGEDADVVIRQAKELYNDMDYFFDVVRCRRCGLCFTSPRPTLDTMAFFYPDTAGYFQANSSSKPPNFRRKRAYAHYLRATLGYHLPPARVYAWDRLLACALGPYFRMRTGIRAMPPLPEGGRLLDVGCSWGRYLLRMKNFGWNVYGLEPNAKAARHAGELLGPSAVFQGFLDQAPWEPGFFDVLVMKMSLEHCHDPNQVLQKAAVLLTEV